MSNYLAVILFGACALLVGGANSRISDGAARWRCHQYRAPSEYLWSPELSEGQVFVDAIPVDRIVARYPRSESKPYVCVVFRFDVNETGRTENHLILFRAPEDAAEIFDTLAIKAAKKWKYEPATIDGVPIRRPYLVSRMVFEFR